MFFFHELCPRLGIQQPYDWYRFSAEKVLSIKGASSLLLRYDNTLFKLLLDMYKDQDVVWQPWKFVQAPKGFDSEMIENYIRGRDVIHLYKYILME